jgi:two-component system LytT family sensor kinase
MTPRSLRQPAAQRVLAWTFVWTVIVLLFISQNVVGDIAAERPIRWFNSVLKEVLYWAPFAAATPLFTFMAYRYPVEGGANARGRRHTLLLHAAAALGFGLLQPLLADAMSNAAAQAVLGPDDPRTAQIAAAQVRSYPVHVITAFWKYGVIIAVISAVRFYKATQESRVRAAHLERQLAASQLSALKMQLHPHFLFNALNSAAMLAITDPPRSHTLLVQLAELFRSTLGSSSVLEVPLRSELDFLDRYLAIERFRFEDRLVVAFDVGDDTDDLLVPSLILQPVVENSIRHGLEHKRDALHLTIRSRCVANSLVLEVEDDGRGLPTEGGQNGRPAFGVGLANVEQRLLAANGRATPIEFDRNGSRAAGLVVRLRLPIRRSHEAVLV